MRKTSNLIALLVVISMCIPFPSDCYAARQVINGSDQLYGAGGSTPAADGARFRTDNTLTTTGDGDNFAAAAPSILVDAPGNIGTLTCVGSTTISGNVGAAATSLKALNADGGSGKTVALDGNSYISTLNFGGDGKVTIAAGKDFTGTITTTTNDTGTLTFKGNSTYTGNIGATGFLLNTINVNGAAKTVAFSGDVFATSLSFGGDNTATIADSKTLTAKITTDTNNTGTLTLDGTSTVAGQVATTGKRLKEVKTGATVGTVTFENNVFAYVMTVSNTGFVAFNGNLTCTTGLNYAADGTVRFANGSALTGAVTTTAGVGTGTMTFLGDATVNDKLALAGTELKQVNIDGTGKTVAFKNSIHALTLNFGGDSTFTITTGDNIDAVVTTSADNTGTATFLGNANVTGTVGAAGAALRAINVNGVGKNVNFQDDVVASSLNFGGDGTVTMDAGKNLTATVTTSLTNTGTLTFNGDSVVTGNVGTASAVLAQINADGNSKNVTFNGDVFATALNFGADGKVTIGAGNNLNAAVITSADNTGTLRFDGATTTGGMIGVVGTALQAVNFYGATNLGHDIAAYTTTIRNNATVTLSRNVTVTGNLVNNVATSVLDIGLNMLTLAGAGAGMYTQNAGATLRVEASGDAAGSIVGSGNATVNAASVLTVAVNSYVPNNAAFKIIDGAPGGAVNVPGTITSSNAMYTFAGTTDGDDLTITATRASTFQSVATGNGAAAGAVLESIGNAGATGDMLTVINALNGLPTTQAMGDSLQTVVPVVDGGVNMTSYSAMNQFIATTVDHLENAIIRTPGVPTGIATGGDYLKGVDMWTQGFGDYAQQNERGASNGYNATVWGIAGGADKAVYYDTTRVGLGSGYAQSFVRSKDNCGKTDIDSYQGVLYGGYQDPDRPYYVDCAFTFAYNTYDSSRQIGIGAINRVATADYNGQQYSVYTGFGYAFDIRKLIVTPMVSAQYMRLHVAEYTEDGAGALSLHVADQNYDMFQTGFGAKCEYPVKLKYLTVVPELHAKWLYDFIGDTQATTSTFSGGGGSFATNGFTPAQSTWDFGTKISLITKNNMALEVNYDFQVKEDYWEHTGWVNISVKL